jgi:hypothetical protein
MIEYKQNISKFVPVRIFDQSGQPVGGIPFGSVQAAVMKADGSTTTIPVTIVDWTEITTGAFSGAGVYLLKLPATVMDQTGLLTYSVSNTGQKTYVGAIKIVANEEVDTYTRIGAPVLTTISADIAGVKSDVAGVAGTITTLNAGITSIQTVVNLLKKYEEGRWKIHITGGDANRLVLYDTDDTTPLLKFDLKDSGGAATFINPFERVPFP